MTFQTEDRCAIASRSVSAWMLAVSSMIIMMIFIDGLTPIVAQDANDANVMKKSDGSDKLLAWQVTRSNDVLRAVFGDRLDCESSKFVSTYEGYLRPIHNSFQERAGRFRHVVEYRSIETENGDYLEVRCQWEKAVMLVRLTFDNAGRMTGFWLARDSKGPTPAGFRRGGYVVGDPMLKIAGVSKKHGSSNLKTLELQVTLAAPGGSPLDRPPGQISIWKQTTDPDAHPSSQGDLITLLDGTRWQWVLASPRRQSEHRFLTLSPGNYRVVVGRTSDSFDYVSEPIRVVDPTQPTVFMGEFVAPEFVKHRITLKLTDSQTGKPVEKFLPHVRFYHDGVPIRRSSLQYYNMEKVDGGWQFDRGLRAGKVQMVLYGLWGQLPGGNMAVIPRHIIELDVDPRGPEEPVEYLADLTTPELTEEQARKIWPWEVYGKVADQQGQSLEGVEVHAHCGSGSAEVALTHSKADGTYRLRLAPSPFYGSERIRNATVANAWIQAVGPGLAESSLCRQGDLGLIEEGKEPSSFHHRRLRRGSLVKRNEPFGPVDFVMTPDIQLEVTLLDTEEKPITDRRIGFQIDSIDDGRDAPNARNGVYHIDRVPVGQAITFYVVGTTNKPNIKRSAPVLITEGGRYQVTLQTIAIDGSTEFDLAVTSVINAEGEDVLESVQTARKKGP